MPITCSRGWITRPATCVIPAGPKAIPAVSGAGTARWESIVPSVMEPWRIMPLDYWQTRETLRRLQELSRGLEPVYASSKEEIKPRMPWLMEPDCRSCHTNFNIFEDGFEGTAFNRWVPGFEALYRNRTDNHGVMCIACHGSTHAVYGAYNKYGIASG